MVELGDDKCVKLAEVPFAARFLLCKSVLCVLVLKCMHKAGKNWVEYIDTISTCVGGHLPVQVEQTAVSHHFHQGSHPCLKLW